MGVAYWQYGGGLALMPSFTADFFGAKNLGFNYGLVFVGWGLGFFMARVGGVIQDATGSLNLAFYISGALLVAGVNPGQTDHKAPVYRLIPLTPRGIANLKFMPREPSHLKDKTMVYHGLIEIPFVLDFSNLKFDTTIIFIVSVLLAITVNAEAQAFMATVLGDARADAKDRFHFQSPLSHGAVRNYLLCGGRIWLVKRAKDRARQLQTPRPLPNPRKICRPRRQSHARLDHGQHPMDHGKLGHGWTRFFTILMAVNLMVFVASFLPIPPLAGATIVSFFFPERLKRSPHANQLVKSLPYLFVAALLVMRANHCNLFSDHLYPVFTTMFDFIAG